MATNHYLGVCEPFMASSSEDSSLEACVDACLPELQMDEHFFQERWPVVSETHSVESPGRPKGCLLTYTREPEGDHWTNAFPEDKQEHWTDVPPSIHKWEENRFHRLQRVDPVDKDDLQDKRWNAYCFQPCQKHADCATSRDGKLQGYTCDKGTCQRNPKYWEADLDPQKPDMVLVTGASSGYFSGLKNFAASARYWAPYHKLVVYNLGGLHPEHLKEIESWSNVIAVEWKDGIPAAYPSHVHVGKKYAWKPIIINETLTKYKAMFWLDAGCTLTGPITPVEKIIHRNGIFLVKGQDLDMKPKSHAKTYEWFNFTKSEFEAGPHFAGGIQGHLSPSRFLDRVVIPNAACAMEKNCVDPAGSSLAAHRFDQTSVSILSYHPKVKVPHHTEYLAAQKSQLASDLANPSFRFIWTARQGCQFYKDRENPAKQQ